MKRDDLADVFEPYDRLIEIEVGGRCFSVPENNSILRCLQYIDAEGVSHADLCWNGDCLNCRVWIKTDETEKSIISCRNKAVAGMKITRLSNDIPFLADD